MSGYDVPDRWYWEDEPTKAMRQDADQQDWLAEHDEHKIRHYDHLIFASQPPLDANAARLTCGGAAGRTACMRVLPTGSPPPDGSGSNDSTRRLTPSTAEDAASHA